MYCSAYGLDLLCKHMYTVELVLKRPLGAIQKAIVIDAPKAVFNNFIGAAAVVKALKGLRILQVGARPTGFLSVRCNEAQLLERFGIEVVTLTVQDIYERWSAVRSGQKELVVKTMEYIKNKVDKCNVTDENLEKIAALRIALEQAANELGCRVGCVNCSDPLRNATGIMPCFVLGDLTGDGLPMICESDIHGAISTVMAIAAELALGTDDPTFLMDLTNRHEFDENRELLWHCGVFPLDLKKPGTCSELTHHYGAPKEGTCRVNIKNGNITVMRFDCAHDEYSVIAARGRIVLFLWVLPQALPSMPHFTMGRSSHPTAWSVTETAATTS